MAVECYDFPTHTTIIGLALVGRVRPYRADELLLRFLDEVSNRSANYKPVQVVPKAVHTCVSDCLQAASARFETRHRIPAEACSVCKLQPFQLHAGTGPDY